MTEKPSVPSDEELRLIEVAAIKRCPAEYATHPHLVGRQALWLAGYHARDASIASLESTLEKPPVLNEVEKALLELPKLSLAVEHWKAMYREVDLERVKAQSRVTELESEVVKLREKVRLATETLADDRDIAALRILREAAPRRTPELTERVADYLSRYNGWRHGMPEIETMAREILGLVFGKKEE